MTPLPGGEDPGAGLGLPFMPVIMAFAAFAGASTFIWNAPSPGTWSTTTNWSPNGLPASSDTVIFNGTSTQQSIVDNASFAGSVKHIEIQAGFTDSLKLNRTLWVTDSFVQSGGTFFSGNQVLSINGSFTLTAGTFTCSSDSMDISKNMTITGGTFNPNSGKINLGMGSGMINIGSLALNDVIISKSAFNLDINGTLNVNGTLTIQAIGTFSSGTIAAKGDIITKSSTFSGPGLLIINGTGTQNISAPYNSGYLPGLQINKSSGTLNLADTLKIARNFIHTLGAVNAGTGTVEFAGNANDTIDAAGISFNNVKFNLGPAYRSWIIGTLDVNGSLFLSGSSTPWIENGTITVAKDLYSNVNPLSGNAAITLDGATDQTINTSGWGQIPSGVFTINKPSGKARLGSSFHVAGDLTITMGVLDQGNSGYGLTVYGNVTVNAGAYWVNNAWGGDTLGGSVTNNGTITLNGYGNGCGDGDLFIRSTSNGVQRTWSGGGVFNLIDCNVQDMAGTLTAWSSVNNGNCTWTVNGTCPPVVWDGTGPTNNWSDPGNWSGDYLPGSSDSVAFNATSSKNCSLDIPDTVRHINFTNYAGAFNFGNGILCDSGIALFSPSMSIIPGAGMLKFIGNATQPFTPKSGAIMPNIEHAGPGTLQLTGNNLRAMSFRQSNGTFNLNTFQIDSIVNDFIINNGNNGSLSGLAGRTIKVKGNMSLNGAGPGSLLNLFPASPYTLAVQGSLYADFCAIGRSTASLSTGYATHSGDSLSNTNWVFGNTKVWSGTGNWNSGSNWGGTVPGPADSVVFNAGSACNLDVNASVRCLVFTAGFASSFSFNGNRIIVKNLADFRSTGAFTDVSVEFTGPDSNFLIPKFGMPAFSKIVQNGPGVTVNSMYPFKTDTLIVQNGTFALGSTPADTVNNLLDLQGGLLDMGNRTLRIAAQNVNLATPGFIKADSAVISLHGTGAQTFTPKPGMFIKTIELFDSVGGGTTVSTNGFRTGNLLFYGGSLNLGTGLTDSAGNISGIGTLNFGSSTLKTSSYNVNLDTLTGITAGTGTLEFTRPWTQNFKPKFNTMHPVIKTSGTGTVTLQTNRLITPKIIIGPDSFVTNANFKADTVIVGSSGILDFGFFQCHDDTVKTMIGTGKINLFNTSLNVLEDLNLSTFSSVTNNWDTLRFIGSSAQIFTPKPNVTHRVIEQNGTGGTTIQTNGFKAYDLKILNGAFNLGAGLNDSAGTISGAGPGTLNFGSSVLSTGGSSVDLGGIGTVVPSTGAIRMVTGITGTYYPRTDATDPSLICNSPTMTINVNSAPLKCPKITVASGTLALDTSCNTDTIAVASGAYLYLSSSASIRDTVKGLTGSGYVYLQSATLCMDGSLNMAPFATFDATNGKIKFIGTGAKNFVPRPNTLINTLSNDGTGTTTVQTNGFKAYTLEVTNGTLHLGTGLVDSVTTDLVCGGTGALYFGSSTLRFGGDTADFSALSALVAGTGKLEFYGSGSQALIPKYGPALPPILMTGTGTLYLAGLPLKTPLLDIANGMVYADTLFNIDSVHIGASGNLNLGGAGGNIWYDTVGTITGTGILNLNYMRAVVTRNLDLTTFSNVMTMSNSGFTFASPSPVTFTPRPETYLNYMEQKGPGTLTITGNGFYAFEFKLSGGTLNLGAGLSDSVMSLFTAMPGASLDFGSSTLNMGASLADFSNLTSLTPGTGLLRFIGNSGQGFIPKAGTTFPGIEFSGTGILACSTNALQGGNLTVNSGSFAFSGSGLVHSIDTLSGTGDLDFAGANIAIKGDADFSGMTNLFGVGNTDTLFMVRANGVQVLSAPPSGTLPVIAHTGDGRLQLAANNLQTYGFLNNGNGRLDLNSRDVTTGTSGDFTILNGTDSTLIGLDNRTLTVDGNAILNGRAGSLLNLNTAADWTLTPTGIGTVKADYANLGHSVITGGSWGRPLNSTNAGNNQYWDFFGPTAVFTSPLDHDTLGSLASISGTATDSGTGTVKAAEITIQRTTDAYYWNGGGWQGPMAWLPATGTGSWSFSSLPSWAEGEYILQARATDSLDNAGSPDSINFYIDKSAPVSLVTTPSNGGAVMNVSSIMGTASDLSGISQVQITLQRNTDNYYWNGSMFDSPQAWLSASGTTGWSFGGPMPPWVSGMNYTVKSKATDNSANVETPGAGITFTYDNTAPASAVTNPVNGKIVAGLGMLNGTASDDDTVTYVQLTIQRSSDSWYWNGSVWGGTQMWLPATGTLNWSFDASAATVTSGLNYTIVSKARDSAMNSETPGAGVTVTMDITAPASSVTTPANASTLGSLALISGTASDAAAGVKTVQVLIKRVSDNYTWNGSAFTVSQTWLNASGTTSWTYNSSGVTFGAENYTIIPKAMDSVNNTETPGAGNTFTFDNGAPVSSVTMPMNGAVVTNVSSIMGSASDPSGISQVQITLQRGSDNWYWNGASSWVGTQTWINATYTSGWSYSTPMPSWVSGMSYTVKSKATDNSANVETPGAGITFTYDNTAPASAVTNPVNGKFVAGLGILNGTASDDDTVTYVQLTIQRSSDSWYWNGSVWGGTQMWLPATGTTSWSFDASAATVTSGLNYTIVSKARDSAMNSETPGAGVTVTMDITAPASSVTTPANASTLGSVPLISGSASDAASGIKTVQVLIKRVSDNYTWNGSAFAGGDTWLNASGTTGWTYNSSGVTFGTGDYTIQSKAMDSVNNTETPGTGNTFTFDAGAPVSVITVPGNGGQMNGWPTLMGTASDAGGIKQVDIALSRLSDNLWWNGVSSWTAGPVWLAASGTDSWDYLNAVDWTSGRFLMQSRATDSADNVETPGTGNKFIVDTTKPVSAVTLPAAASLINSLTAINGTSSDPVYTAPQNQSITIVRNSDGWYWNNAAWVSTPTWIMTDNKGSWTRNFSMPSMTDGFYTITPRATDSSGNQEIPGAGVQFRFDGTAPSVLLTSAAANPVNAPFGVTIAFSERVRTFTPAEIIVGNGTASGVATSDSVTFTASITPSAAGPVTVNVNAGAAQDSAGNNNTAATQLSRTYDNSGPSVTLASAAPNPTNASPFGITIVFSEQASTFRVTDLSVGNGTASALMTSDSITFTANITPAAAGLVTVNVSAGVATDLAGNGNTAAVQLTRRYDNVAPSVSVTWIGTDPTSVSPIPVTIAFSERVRTFTLAEIIVGNGTASGVATSDSVTFTANITPTADGLVTVNVNAGAAQDSAGNNNTAALQFSRNYDGTVPAITLSSSAPMATNLSPIPLAVAFTEKVRNFALADITVGNGTAGNLATSDSITYTADITPTAGGPVTVNVAASAAQDMAGNNSTAATQLSRTYDNSAPTVLVTSPVPAFTNQTMFGATVTFSELVRGFDLGDISVGNGTASGLSTMDSMAYALSISPAADGPVTVDVAAAAALDPAGNPNSAAPQLLRTFDGSAPSNPAVAILDNNGFTRDSTPVITLSATGADSVRLKVNAGAWTSWKTMMARDSGLNIGLTGEGAKGVSAQFKDRAGNLSATVTDSTIFDASGPTGASIVITDNRGFTNNDIPALMLAATGADSMRFRLNGAVWTLAEVYAASKSGFDITAGGEGQKRVDVEFIDRAGNVTKVSDTTLYDVTAPSGASLSITDNNGFTNDSTPDLALAAAGADSMRFRVNAESWSSWKPYAAVENRVNIGLLGEGAKRLSAEYMDRAGNVSSAVTDSTWFDATPPSGAVVTILDNNGYVNVPSVDLSLAASGADSMRFQVNAEGWGAWEAFDADKTGLAVGNTGNGLKTIRASFKDRAGNLSAPAADSTRFDTTPPDNDVVLSGSSSDTGSVNLSWNASSVDSLDADSIAVLGSASATPDNINWAGALAYSGRFPVVRGQASNTTAAGLNPGATYYFSLMVRDAAGNWSGVSAASRAAVTTLDRANPPVFASITDATVQEDDLFSLTVTATDANNDPITYSKASGPAGLNLNGSTGLVTWLPDNGQVGVHNVVVTASDGTLLDTVSFTVTVQNVNDAPVITAVPSRDTAFEETAYGLNLTAGDIDSGDVMTWRVLTGPAGLSLAPATGGTTALAFTPTNAQAGDTLVVIETRDMNEGADTLAFTLTIVNTNDAPVISNKIASASVAQDSLFTYTLAAADPDKGDSLRYTIVKAPAGLARSGARFTWRPGNADVNEFTGPDTVVLAVADRSGASDSVRFTLLATNVNDAPVVAILEEPSVNYGAVRVRFSVQDPDRLLGLDSSLFWTAGLSKPHLSFNLYQDADSTRSETAVAEFYPVYDDTLILRVQARDADAVHYVLDTLVVGLAAQSVVNRTFPAQAWQMIALPSKDLPLPAAFADSLDKLLRWDAAAKAYAGSDEGLTDVKRGLGYWFLGNRDVPYTVADADRLKDVNSPCTLSLDAGWNMISSPYAYAVRFPAGLGDTLFTWNGSAYAATDVLEPWKGYFFHSTGGSAVFTGATFVPDSAAKALRARPKTLFRDVNDWTLEVSAVTGNSADCGNAIGLNPKAGLGADACDIHEPPVPPMGGVSLFFEPLNDPKTRLCRSLIPSAGATHQWVMAVAADGDAVVSFDGIRNLPAKYFLYLGEGSDYTDLRQAGSLRLPAEGTRYYTVVATTDASFLAKVVRNYDLAQNHPNPFNPATTIGFAVPVLHRADGRPLAEKQRVTLNVYDLRGQLVRTLANGGFEPGRKYAVSWDGRNDAGKMAASGVYFYRITVDGKFVKTRKMALVK